MKIMLAGDTHGDIRNVAHKIDAAKKVGGIQRIVILGDYGCWWGFEGVKFIDECNELAKKNNLQIFAIPGNHECYDLWNSIVDTAQKTGATSHGWAYARTHVLLSPRVHAFKWGGKRFVVAGGAVSIDKQYRLEYQAKKGKQIWSPDEQLTDDEVGQAQRYANEYDKIDYFLTHDCSNRTPWHGRLKPDPDSQMHRDKIDCILGVLSPTMHFHGHMHTRYDWMNLVAVENGQPHYTQTYGLECNRDFWSWGVLNTETDEFVFGPDLPETPIG